MPTPLPLASLLFFSAAAMAQAPATLTHQVAVWSKQSNAPKFEYALTDLNDDGVSDAIVLMDDSDYCGSGGCSLLVFKGGLKNDYKLISSSTVSSTPIRVTKDKSHGWKTLVVHANKVGDMQLKFNGTRYPFNPSVQPKATATQLKNAQTLIE